MLLLTNNFWPEISMKETPNSPSPDIFLVTSWVNDYHALSFIRGFLKRHLGESANVMLNFAHFRNYFATMPFTSEQDRFIVMAHFQSVILNPDGNWSYSLQSCIEQFMQQYPDEMIEYDIFKQHKCRLVHRFETKNCTCKGKSTGRPTVLTENVIENIQERINRCPKKDVSQLSQQTGPSVGTCFKALKRNLHMHPYKVTIIQR
ncbi:hypothetical protein FQA39_LY12693 [Lamprigera yunnana]|nr:hypothetical protein FQA39_LY12693 [Lamprigera yunnana]